MPKSAGKPQFINRSGALSGARTLSRLRTLQAGDILELAPYGLQIVSAGRDGVRLPDRNRAAGFQAREATQEMTETGRIEHQADPFRCVLRNPTGSNPRPEARIGEFQPTERIGAVLAQQ